MSDLDQQAILDFAAALAHNLAADYVRRADPPYFSDEWLRTYEQQSWGLLIPGIAVFVSRLSAALPGDFDLHSVLTRFFADPSTVSAFQRYGQDAAAGTTEIANGLTRAGLPAGAIGDSELREALSAWGATEAEVSRQWAAAGLNYSQSAANTPLYSVHHPPAVAALQAAMADLVRALAEKGLSRIAAGDILANDGTSVLFTWRRGQQGARETPDETSAVQETGDAGAEPPAGGPEDLVSGAGQPFPGADTPSPTVPTPSPTAPTTADGVVSLRLDTAAPPQVTVGIPFDLAASIRLLDSPLVEFDDLSLRESTAFAAQLPAGATGFSMRIQIAAPDCDIIGGDTRPLRVLTGQDGPTVYFQLTPRRAGSLSIIVTVYQETDWIGSTRLRTEVAGSATADATRPGVATPGLARGAVALNVQSRPLGAVAVNRQTLRDALDKGYSLSELRDLCFELDIDYDDLPGEGQSAKARELVIYCEHRGLWATLVERVMRDRPHLLAA